MPKTKENKGITLIALVVTIIVLLILAGVTISAISGNNSIEKAGEAKDLNDSSNELEDIRVAVIHAEEKSFDGTVSAADLKITLNGIVSQEEIDKITGNGPWIVNKNGRDYKIEDDGTVIDYTKVSRINNKIGNTIIYPTLGGATGWKIFYADNEEMFIIPTNIISKTNASAKDSLNNGIPLSSKTVEEVMGSGTYGGKWNSTWLKTPGVVTTENRHKAVAYLCDPENWEAYVAKTTGENPTKKIAGSYAVGGPTIELFVASWNIKASSSKRVSLPLGTTVYGYNQTISSGITTSEANALYNPTGSGYYWLATPGPLMVVKNSVRGVYCQTNTESGDYLDWSNTNMDFRPLVSIPINNVDFSGENVVIKDDNGNVIQ